MLNLDGPTIRSIQIQGFTFKNRNAARNGHISSELFQNGPDVLLEEIVQVINKGGIVRLIFQKTGKLGV